MNNNGKIATILSVGIEFINSLLLMKVLSLFMIKSQYGDYLLIMSILVGVLGITYSAFDQGFLRNINEYSNEEKLSEKFTANIFFYGLFSILLLVIILALIKVTEPQISIVPFFFWLFFRWFANFQITVATGQGMRWLEAKSKIFEFLSRYFLITYALIFDRLDVYWVILAQIFSSFVQILYLFTFQKKYISKITMNSIKLVAFESSKFCWPMMLWGGFSWLQNMSARWIISKNLNNENVAEYSVLYSASSIPINLLITLITTYFVPIMYRKVLDDPGYARKFVIKLAINFILVTIFIVLFSYFFGGKVVELISSGDYSKNAHFLPVMILFLGINAGSSLLAYESFVEKKLKRLLAPSIVPGIIMFLSCLYLTSAFGINGAVYSLIISSTIGSALYIITFMIHKG